MSHLPDTSGKSGGCRPACLGAPPCLPHSLGVSTDRRNGTSFELDDLSPESQRESTPLSQRLSHILARHDVVQESFRAQTQVSAPTPYMLHSRIFFRKLNNKNAGCRSKPQPLHMRPPPQTQGDVFETFEAGLPDEVVRPRSTGLHPELGTTCGWVGGGGGGGDTTHPLPGPTHPPPPRSPKRLGQIFFRAFGQSKISSGAFLAN